MLKLTIDHVASVTLAQRCIISGIVPNMSPRHRQELEDDLERLKDVKKFILDLIYNPGLPLQIENPKKF